MRKEPSFVEFVEYLVRDKNILKIMENIFPKKVGTPVSKYDEHWRPMFLLCPPCHFKFDVIVKMETFDRYPDYFLSKNIAFQVNWVHNCVFLRDTEFILSQRNLETEVSLRKKHSSTQSQDSQVREFGEETG